MATRKTATRKATPKVVLVHEVYVDVPTTVHYRGSTRPTKQTVRIMYENKTNTVKIIDTENLPDTYDEMGTKIKLDDLKEALKLIEAV